MTARRAASIAATAAALALWPAHAWGHGDEPEAPVVTEEGAAATEEEAHEAELEALALQPARVLAQQALATLEVSGDEAEAVERLEAATMSDDKDDVDVELVGEALETLEAGQQEEAVSLLDTALSRPLGAESGKALHEAGREFEPGTGTQEVVGIVVGVVLMLLGAWALRPRRGGSIPDAA